MTLLTPEEISGKWKGNGCFCTPEGDKLTITPACAGGICVYRSCYGIPCCGSCCGIPCCGSQYYYKFGSNCGQLFGADGPVYDDVIGEGLLTPDANTISRLNMCGAGYVRDDGGPRRHGMPVRARLPGRQRVCTEHHPGASRLL